MVRRLYRAAALVVIVLGSGPQRGCRAWVECPTPAATDTDGATANHLTRTDAAPIRDLCPDGNTCCESCSTPHSTCISGHPNQSKGECCTDDAATRPGTTGCGSGYRCARSTETRGVGRNGTDLDDDEHRYYCVKTKADDPDSPDVLPRYRLCSLPPEAYTRVHGLSLIEDVDRSQQPTALLAYLSTMGALDSPDPADLQRHVRVETVVVMVHGSGRNVDDYLCATSAALPPSDAGPDPSRTMVIAPWFLSDEDGPVSFYNRPTTVTALRWLEEGPIEHTWRYGADALNSTSSSYAAMDAILGRLERDQVRFPSLRRVVVAGHSAGGQYTQRWALLSNSPVLSRRSSVDPNSRAISVRTVVANPKSFCWLDARRYVRDEFRVPDARMIAQCPEYNQWEWGLDVGGYLPTPYKDAAIEHAGGVGAVIQRYATRDVVYLAGELDVIPNGDCPERVQGKFRRIRSQRFYESLKVVYGRQVHRRIVVKGVHHDHALMFQSPEGQGALFDETVELRGDQ